MSAMQLPLVLTKLSYLIDNPWAVSLARADMAGLILADSLIDRNLGVRPITLVGFSIGSRVIFSCLKELANRGAFGLIQNVYLFGSPMVVKQDEYLRAKAVVSGRFVNGYANNDWILGYLFRATSGGIMRVAGLGAIDIPGIENYDVTALVPGHMAYRKAMPRLLREVGWIVSSDEFAEIEDPDPENHMERQRELISEIEEARRELEKKPEKRGFKSLFSRNKRNAERKAWEVYDEQSKNESGEASSSTSQNPSAGINNGSILFDIDAIRAEVAELAKEGIEVREIESTLPPMKLNINSSTSLSSNGTTSIPIQKPLRQMRSFSGFAPQSLNGSYANDNGSSSNGESLSLSNTAETRTTEVLAPPPSTHTHVHSVIRTHEYELEYADHNNNSGSSPLSPPVQMSFESAATSPRSSSFPSPSPSSSSVPRKSRTPVPFSPPLRTSTGLSSPRGTGAPASWDEVEIERPRLLSARTMPATLSFSPSVGTASASASAVGLGLDHNAWADEDETAFGGQRKGMLGAEEEEVSMTFE